MTFNRMAPVLPVSDLSAAMEHYSRLGFAVRHFEGEAPYAFAERDGVEIHLNEVKTLKPKRNTSAVYLYVDNADELYEHWKASGANGRLIEPRDTDYGLREGASLDADANLIRFGSPMETP